MIAPSASSADRCEPASRCITCGDVAVAMTALVQGRTDARCADGEGREETVALELVGPVAPGDRLIVHGGVALARLDAP